MLSICNGVKIRHGHILVVETDLLLFLRMETSEIALPGYPLWGSRDPYSVTALLIDLVWSWLK